MVFSSMWVCYVHRISGLSDLSNQTRSFYGHGSESAPRMVSNKHKPRLLGCNLYDSPKSSSITSTTRHGQHAGRGLAELEVIANNLSCFQYRSHGRAKGT